ncbi:MAG: hypothetical protein ACRESR_10750 [Gammaproteobacteria bacterium]
MRRLFAGASRKRYPVAHTAPWLFVVLLVGTTFFIVCGIVQFEPVMSFFRWLAIVL